MVKESYKPKYDLKNGKKLLHDLGYNEDSTVLMSPQDVDTTIDDLFKSAGLTYKLREVIKLRKGLGDSYLYTLEEAGHVFKQTRERIRQMETKAMGKLRKVRKVLEDSMDER